MNDTVLGLVVAWLTDPENWSGPAGIPVRTGEHLLVSALSVLIATAVALPVGVWLGHTGRGGQLASGVSNLGRAVPTFAVLVVLALSPAPFGIGNPEVITVTALVVFALAPILTNAYTGMRGVDPDAVDAARGMGMRELDVLLRVELPLALPLVVAGLRLATTQVVATATIAAFVVGPGLGRFINSGLSRQDTGEFIGGAVLVAALALVLELLFELVQRAVAPVHRRRSRATGPPVVTEPSPA